MKSLSFPTCHECNRPRHRRRPIRKLLACLLVLLREQHNLHIHSLYSTILDFIYVNTLSSVVYNTAEAQIEQTLLCCHHIECISKSKMKKHFPLLWSQKNMYINFQSSESIFRLWIRWNQKKHSEKNLSNTGASWGGVCKVSWLKRLLDLVQVLFSILY